MKDNQFPWNECVEKKDDTPTVLSYLEDELDDRFNLIERVESQIVSCSNRMESLRVELSFHYILKEMIEELIEGERCKSK